MQSILDFLGHALPLLPSVAVIAAAIVLAAIALSSASFVRNIVAGMMLRAVRNFRAGDFIEVGEHFGRITSRGLLSTEIQTEDRALVTLPNLHLVTNPVKVIQTSGTQVWAEVSLGYDVPHRQVERLLCGAATDAGLAEPATLVMGLGDASVTYRVVGLLEEVTHLLTARSRLRCAMLDRLHGDHVARVMPGRVGTRPTEPAPQKPLVVGIASDRAEEAETLEQLEAEHRRTREAIAVLADRDDAAQSSVAREQEHLARRLARIESAMEKLRHEGETS